MLNNNDCIARAFELADTGKYTRISQIRVVLGQEGFSLWQLSQLAGKDLAGKLRARIAAACLVNRNG